MRKWLGILFVAIVALPSLLAVFQSRPTPTTPANAETLLILSPHRREVRLEYDRAFTEWLQREHQRTARIEWLDAGGTSKLLKFLESQFTTNPDAPGVHILFGGGVTPYLIAREKGWLRPAALPADLLAAIPPTCAGAPVYDPEGYWYGVALSGFGIVYNQPLLDRLGLPPPASWQDLGQPGYFTWLASGDPRSSGSVHMCYEIIMQALGFEEGWSLITRLCANVRQFGEGGGVAPRDVAAGEAVAGMVIDQYARTVIEAVGDNALRFVLPQGTTVIGADAIGIIRSAATPDLADLFVTFALSAEGQRILYQPRGVNGQHFSLCRAPVRAPLYAEAHAPTVNPYDCRVDFTYDTGLESRRRRILDDLIGACLIDSHRELTATWAALIRTGLPPDAVARLCTPPVSETELLELAARWEDARFRTEVLNRWTNEARARYKELQP